MIEVDAKEIQRNRIIYKLEKNEEEGASTVSQVKDFLSYYLDIGHKEMYIEGIFWLGMKLKKQVRRIVKQNQLPPSRPILIHFRYADGVDLVVQYTKIKTQAILVD
jgi:hypothetical protein